VPIRTAAPIGAIGIYWASHHRPTAREVRLLQALADSTSIALENVAVYRSLEDRVAERTKQLETANAELARKNRELRELHRQKAELTALVVHDIKSPAAAMKLRAQHRLTQGGTSREARDWRSVLTAADRINRMALDLLDISRGESGTLTPSVAPVRLGELLAEIRTVFEASAASQKQRLVVATPPREPELHADEALLRRVLYNLVDNGLRYTGDGDEVRVELRTPDAGHVELVVADTGPGIQAPDRERIFEKYVRVADPSDDGVPPPVGCGLGLTFCRLAIEAQGGRIWVEGNEPRGSRFHVLLPTRSAPAVR